MPRLLVILSILLLLSMPLYADYHYASHQGTSTYPYTSWETAADSIQLAVNAASPHDTVYIGSGEYHEQITIGTDTLALIGCGWDSTLVWFDDPNEATIHTVSPLVRWAYFEGLHVQNRSGRTGLRGGAYNNTWVNACRFSNPQDPSRGSGIVTGAALDFTIVENCLFDSLDNGLQNILRANYTRVSNCLFYYNYSGSIESSAGGRLIVANNVITKDQGISYTPITGGGDTLEICNNLIFERGDGIGLGSTYGGFCRNNTIRLRNRYYIYWAIGIGGRKVVIEDNSITDVGEIATAIFPPDDLDTMRLAYNNFWRVSQDVTWNPDAVYDTVGNIHQYPMFVDHGSGDFRLQEYSPLIDAGNPDILDVDGSRSDIGVYGGPGGCSYVYLDLAPLIPDSLSAYVDSSGIHITWRNNYEADFNRYQIFRDTVTGFSPSVFNMIGEPDSSYFLDINISPGVSYYYRFTSVDNQRNVSDHSTELAVYQTGMAWDKDGNLRPEYASIEKAYPNPFNQDITIVYSASNLGPQPPEIKLVIYDVQGRIVKTLVDERKPAGTYRIVWDGRNDLGEPVSSGNYITKLYQWGMGAGDFPVKITLVR